jgi:hypothetical protein
VVFGKGLALSFYTLKNCPRPSARSVRPEPAKTIQLSEEIVTKRIFLSIIISIFLFGCISKEESLVPSPTATPKTAAEIVLTQLAIPIITPTIGSIVRQNHDFLPSATPVPTVTPTNVFLPVSNQNEYSDLVINLERTMCFGTCPAYSLTINGNGKGIYEGKFSVKVEGVQKFTLTQEQLSKLVQAFETAHYFSFAEYYAIPATDMSSTTTSITFQGQSKTVEHYGWCLDYEEIVIPDAEPRYAAPQGLCDLENKIDEIVNVKQWTGK